MRFRQVQCPICGTLLNVPPGCANCFVRCAMCRHRFRLPKRIALTDETIAEWLWEGSDGDRDASQADAIRQAAESAAAGKTAVLPALTENIRLLRVDGKGAVFEFPADRLRDAAFRLALPRKCIRCGAHTHLDAHVIIYAPKSQEGFSQQAEHAAGSLTVAEDDVAGLTDPELLDRLPAVPNVPPPASNPMPYWVCDMCTGTGMISGQIQINTETGRGVCRLLIRNLRQAEEFLIAAGGKGSHDHNELRRRIAGMTENPWDILPQIVQHRLEGWFRRKPGERFVTYVPDRDRARSEDGAYGIVISNVRLVFHGQYRHREVRKGEPLKLRLSTTAKCRLNINAPRWEIKHFTLDREGIARLRRALTVAKFNASWS